MLKNTLYILVALFFVFVLVNAGWRYFKKKKKNAVKRIKYEDPKYLELEGEKNAIRHKRAELEIEHPYQKMISLNIKLEKARRNGKENEAKKYEEDIECIFAEYEGADEKQLRMAYHAQLAAMSRRLSHIEIEQRHIILEVGKIS
jgi:hypothetical protein